MSAVEHNLSGRLKRIEERLDLFDKMVSSRSFLRHT